MSSILKATANKIKTQDQQEKSDKKTPNTMSNAADKEQTEAAASKTTRPQPSFAMAMEAFGMGWPPSK